MISVMGYGIQGQGHTGYPVLLRMWDKRLRGYRVMGYRIEGRQ